jgi:hypothetical protein
MIGMSDRRKSESKDDILRRNIVMRRDPVQFLGWLWPNAKMYREQWKVVYSVERNDQTFVVAGNKLGKDFVAGFICIRTFLIHREVRVVTTSVKDDHLRVLWGEIGRFIQTSRIPLTYDRGGPLVVNHREINKLAPGVKKLRNKDGLCKISYLKGMVSEKGEGLAGHHAAYTLAVGDEASGLDDIAYTQMDTWAKRMLMFGNPLPCSSFFYREVKAGDLPAKEM